VKRERCKIVGFDERVYMPDILQDEIESMCKMSDAMLTHLKSLSAEAAGLSKTKQYEQINSDLFAQNQIMYYAKGCQLVDGAIKMTIDGNSVASMILCRSLYEVYLALAYFEKNRHKWVIYRKNPKAISKKVMHTVFGAAGKETYETFYDFLCSVDHPDYAPLPLLITDARKTDELGRIWRRVVFAPDNDDVPNKMMNFLYILGIGSMLLDFEYLYLIKNHGLQKDSKKAIAIKNFVSEVGIHNKQFAESIYPKIKQQCVESKFPDNKSV